MENTERKIEAMDSVEVYQNQQGRICLRQEDPFTGEDHCVVFPTVYADKISKWILEVKEEIQESEAD